MRFLKNVFVLFTNKEYAEMHLVYDQMQFNSRAAIRGYAKRFPNPRQTHRSTSVIFHQILREAGSVVARKVKLDGMLR